MKSRIVTVTLAVAMGLWLNSAAHSQTEAAPPISILQGQGFDDFDSALESELPLQGVPVESATAESLSSTQPPADLSGVQRDAEWIYALRNSLSSAPRMKIALGASGLFVVGVLVWAALASRKRTKRAYRRTQRSAGGSLSRGLEEVVASAQLGRSRHVGGPGSQDPVSGPEWPR